MSEKKKNTLPEETASAVCEKTPAKGGRMELRLAGSGGQGVILASVILAEAAVIAGKYTAQSQSYGPEARGGACRAETLISDTPIGFTKVQDPTFLMTLTEASYQKYAKDLPEGCMLLADESVSSASERSGAVILPILRTAKEKVGKAQCANIVAVGCINEMLHIVDRESLAKAVAMHVPSGTEKINLTALSEGEKLMQGVTA